VALLLLGNLLGGLLLLLCHRYGSLPRMPGHATHDQSLGHSIVGIDRRFKLVFFYSLVRLCGVLKQHSTVTKKSCG
jgi:hypothetical protein